MAKCTRKLIDAEAAKDAIGYLLSQPIGCRYTDIHYGTIESVLAALDALPDASEGFFDYIAKEAHRTGKSPQAVFAAEWEAHTKLKDDSLWPSCDAQQAGDGAEE